MESGVISDRVHSRRQEMPQRRRNRKLHMRTATLECRILNKNRSVLALRPSIGQCRRRIALICIDDAATPFEFTSANHNATCASATSRAARSTSGQRGRAASFAAALAMLAGQATRAAMSAGNTCPVPRAQPLQDSALCIYNTNTKWPANVI